MVSDVDAKKKGLGTSHSFEVLNYIGNQMAEKRTIFIKPVLNDLRSDLMKQVQVAVVFDSILDKIYFQHFVAFVFS